MIARLGPTTTSIIPLGTGGYIPTPRRSTASILVRRDRTALLFDAGTGIARLLDPEFAAHLDGVESLNILLSHYHLDHVVGLTWLPKVWHSEVRIYAPSHPLVEFRAEDALDRLTGAPLFALPLARYPFRTEVIPVAAEATLEIGEFSVRLIGQRHTGGSVGFRVDDCFAYVTDTDAEARHIPFLGGVRLAFMDAFYDTEEYRACGGTATQPLDHGSNTSVAAVAKRASVGTLGLVHLNPSYGEARCTAMLDESRAIFESTVIPEEGLPIRV